MEYDTETCTFKLSKAELKALVEHCSTDKTRETINTALFEAAGGHARVVATDGHRLLRAERDIAANGSARGTVSRDVLVSAGRLLRTAHHELRISVGPKVHRLVAVDTRTNAECGYLEVPIKDVAFPTYSQIIPEFSGAGQSGDTVGVLGVNAGYLASVLLVAKAVGGGSYPVAMMLPSAEFAPLVLTAGAADETRWTVIIMPLRLVESAANWGSAASEDKQSPPEEASRFGDGFSA